MTSMMTATVSFLTVAPEMQSSDIALVCFVRGMIDFAPTIKVERLLNGTIDKAHGRLEISEVTDTGNEKAASTSNGVAQFSPKHAGMIRGGTRVWEFLVRSAPGGQGAVTFRVSAGMPPKIPLEELAKSSSVSVDSGMLNTPQPVKVVLGPKALPRLSAGINQATPEVAPDRYRGFRKGGGDVNALQDRRRVENLSPLLHQIFFQLDAPHTFDPAWDQQAGTNSWTTLSRSAFSVSPIIVAEERWARQVTEMLLLSVYQSAEALYGTLKTSALIAETFVDSSNPYYGLGYVCQDLTTFAVASRGVNLKKRVVNAGSNAAAAVMLASPAAKWYVDISPPVERPEAKSGRPHDLMDGPTTMDLLPLIKQVPDYGPGSVHVFANQRPKFGPIRGGLSYDELLSAYNAGAPVEGKASKLGTATVRGAKKPRPAQLIVTISKKKKPKPGENPFEKQEQQVFLTDDEQFAIDNQPPGAHIGVALRVRHDLQKVQFIDTGALNVPSSFADIVPGSPGCQLSNLDTPGTTQVKSIVGTPYKGTGIFPPLDVAGAQRLRDTVLQLSKARPLGLARFAVLDRVKQATIKRNAPQVLVEPDGALIYASPLLPMWGIEEDQNYHISRFLWSLRQMPNAALLEGVWMLYVPCKRKIKNIEYDFAQALVDSKRSASVIDVAKALLPGADFARELAAVVKPIQDLVVKADGKVCTLANSGGDIGAKHILHALEGRTPTGEVHLPLFDPFPRPPADFAAAQLPGYFGG